VENVLRGLFGFGMPASYQAPFFAPGGTLEQVWGPLLHQLARQLGTQLDELRIVCNKVLTEVPLTVKIGTIEAGTVAGLHFALEGRVNGVARIVIEHFNRMRPEIAPHWPKAEITDEVAYRLVLDGEPRIHCTVDVAAERKGEEGVEVATAMRVINAIPALCAAPPGVTWATALPAYTARNHRW
jgi:4-hydroxy-tetrahydrodipicolinate reductase